MEGRHTCHPYVVVDATNCGNISSGEAELGAMYDGATRRLGMQTVMAERFPPHTPKNLFFATGPRHTLPPRTPMQFVHDAELQTLHISILKLECRSLEPKLTDFLSVCSDVLLRISIQLLHPNGRCSTHWQLTKQHNQSQSSDRFSHLFQRRSHWHQPSPKLASLVGCTFRVG